MERVSQLVEMGFDRENAAKTLTQVDFDVARALDLLLSTPNPTNTPCPLVQPSSPHPPDDVDTSAHGKRSPTTSDTDLSRTDTLHPPSNPGGVPPKRQSLYDADSLPVRNDDIANAYEQQSLNKDAEPAGAMQEEAHGSERLSSPPASSTTESPKHEDVIALPPGPEADIHTLCEKSERETGSRISDPDIDTIATLLSKAGRQEWSARPRTYVILRMIDAMEFMDDFIDLGCFDIALPFRITNLPLALPEPKRQLFIEKQSLVMSTFTIKASRLEGANGARHANLSESADMYLEHVKPLGQGGFGSVDRVRSKLSRKDLVRKRFRRADTFEGNAKSLNFFKNEIDQLKRLSHHHLVKYVGSYSDPEHVGILMMPIADSDLKAFLAQSSFHRAELDYLAEAFGCLCAAVAYLHRQQCRHKDLKPENILVKQRRIFITDFGIARDWQLIGRSTTTGDIGPVSHAYVAPEVMMNDSRNTSSDMWSLGCVYLDMVTVLKGESLASKQLYFQTHGTDGLCPRTNMEACEGWLKKLEGPEDNAPLNWTRALLAYEKSSRPTAETLLKDIHMCTEDRDFYGQCCSGVKEVENAPVLQQSRVDDVSSNEEISDDGLAKPQPLSPHLIESRLRQAAMADDVKSIKRWLRRASKIRASNPRSALRTSALVYAAARGNSEIVNILIRFGVDMRVVVDGFNALCTAINSCNETVTRLLIAADNCRCINEANGEITPLTLAVRRGFHPIVHLLLHRGAAVDQRDPKGSTALYHAVGRGDETNARLLLRYKADVSIKDLNGFSPLHLAAADNYQALAHQLLGHGADIEEVDPTGRRSPLCLAVGYGHLEMARLLLDKGADVNKQRTVGGRLECTYLGMAVESNQVEMVKIILQYRPDLELKDYTEHTVLMIACVRGYIEIAELLLKAGADTGAKSRPEADPQLIYALQVKNFELARLLIKYGANVDAPDTRAGTFLSAVAGSNNLQVMEFLIANKCNVNAQDDQGITALMEAARARHVKALQKLLEHDASASIANVEGLTALHYAVRVGSTEMIKLLIQKGADPLTKDRRGATPLDLAMDFGQVAVEKQLVTFLEDNDRVEFDSRWPGCPIYLSLKAIEDDYEIMDYYGRPMVRPLTEPLPDLRSRQPFPRTEHRSA